MTHAEIPHTTQIIGVDMGAARQNDPYNLGDYSESVPDYARPFPELVYPHPIGPQDASDLALPMLELRARDVAVIAVHNVVHYYDERERFTRDVRDSYLDGTLRTVRVEPAQSTEMQAKQFVDAALKRHIPEVQSEDLGENLFLNSLSSLDEERESFRHSEVNTVVAITEMKRETAERILTLRKLFLDSRPSKKALFEFDKAAGIATALEVESQGFREIVSHLIGARAATALLRGPTPQSAEVDIIHSPTRR